MSATQLPYLPSYLNIPNPPLQNPQKPIAWLGYSAVFGVFSYYAPKTFMVASAGGFVGSVLWFNKLVLILNKQRASDLRAWTIQACQVMWSVGIVLGIQGIYSLGLSAKILKEMRILKSLCALTCGIFGIAVLGSTSYFWARAKQLSQRARWIQMEDYLNYPSRFRNIASQNLLYKSVFFAVAFFPGLTENRRGLHPFIMQFCSHSGKIQNLIHFFGLINKRFQSIPPSESDSWEKWVHAIHQLEDVINQKAVSDELKNALRPIANASEPVQIDQLPTTAQQFFRDLRLESSPPPD